MKNVRFLPAGDTAVAVEFGNEISKEVNARVHALNTALKDSGLKGIVETVPTYRSLMVHYDPGVVLYDELVEETKSLLGRLDHIQSPRPLCWKFRFSTAGKRGLIWTL